MGYSKLWLQQAEQTGPSSGPCGHTEEEKSLQQAALSEVEISSSLKYCLFEGFFFIPSNVVIN